MSLPQLTFEPFTSTKTSLLFAQKKTKAEIEEWNKLWSKYSNEWSALKTRCENLLAVHLEGKDRKKLPSVKNLKEVEEKQILARMLKDCLEENDLPTGQAGKKLSSKVLVEKYRDELKELCKYDNDTKDAFGFVNTWWVFGEVAKELNYKIFMAEVENVGYKRTKRGEKLMPNELFDLEIAPTELNIKDVSSCYDANVKTLNSELQKIKDVKKKAIIKSEIESLKKEKEKVEKTLSKYYRENVLKLEYVDRTEKELLSIFDFRLMRRFRSEQILLREKITKTALDYMRKIEWE